MALTSKSQSMMEPPKTKRKTSDMVPALDSKTSGTRGPKGSITQGGQARGVAKPQGTIAKGREQKMAAKMEQRMAKMNTLMHQISSVSAPSNLGTKSGQNFNTAKATQKRRKTQVLRKQDLKGIQGQDAQMVNKEHKPSQYTPAQLSGIFKTLIGSQKKCRCQREADQETESDLRELHAEETGMQIDENLNFIPKLADRQESIVEHL